MLGIATISALAGWKNQQAASGSLNEKELNDKGQAIQLAYLTPPQQPLTFQLTVIPSDPVDDSGEGVDSASVLQQTPAELVPLAYEKPIDRPSVTAVLRATARVYLKTVVFGCVPDNAEVATAVSEAMDVFRGADGNECDRAMLFGLTMVGSVVKSKEDKDFILEKFKNMNGMERMGNSIQVGLLGRPALILNSFPLTCLLFFLRRPDKTLRKFGDDERRKVLWRGGPLLVSATTYYHLHESESRILILRYPTSIGLVSFFLLT